MQHLIKRSTGPRASKAAPPTLAERLAANRKASQAAAAEELEEQEFEQVEDVLDLTEEAPLEAAPASAPANDTPANDTDAIVEAAKAARSGGAKPQASGKTCLVVDDSRVIRKVASKIASDLGFTVIEAEHGEEALLRCKQTMPDLVLTDWDMPVMDGPSFVTALREKPGGGAVKVVFCTSKGEAGDIHKGIGAGADDYIVKPFDEAAITSKLQKLGVI
ncbi:response regulator [Aurantiacibacter sediminis]|uniref:Response regulator n=1 Tax=Aurantiacibacter sediminis TaxID=2793064 RepID=A0ABS0N4X4_9SPHN|nr:response regulator [Aurantiacibacter sediminis]MBH5322844.1 response regulator [Aurantiacibacter sediminis]